MEGLIRGQKSCGKKLLTSICRLEEPGKESSWGFIRGAFRHQAQRQNKAGKVSSAPGSCPLYAAPPGIRPVQQPVVYQRLGHVHTALHLGSRVGTTIASSSLRTNQGSAIAKGLAELGRSVLVARAELVRGREEAAQRGREALKSIWEGKAWPSHLPPLAKTVGAVSWTCVRSHIVPRFLAIVLGEATWRRRHLAEAEQLLRNPELGSQAQMQLHPLVELIQGALEALILTLRSLFLLVLFTPVMVTGPFADSFGPEFRKQWLYLLHASLERAGAAFIKWGQWAATRPDLFPKDMCTELARLQTKAPAHSFEVTRRTVEGAFGRKISDIFDDFEEEPVASGSIAQIHRAVLRRPYPNHDGGESQLVAVKVRHPGVSDLIRRDFVIMNCIARISSNLPGIRWLRLEDSIQQFAVFMMAQVDLAREAANLSRFIYNFRHWKDVSFPRPIYPLVHPAVLVESFEHGESVTRYVDRPHLNDNINTALAHLGSHTLLKMLLVDNFIHADLHPGNILVRVHRGKSPSPSGLFRVKPHVVLLDVGMTAELSPRDRANMLEFFKAIAKRDGTKVAECTLNFTRDQSCPDPPAFIKSVAAAFRVWEAMGKKVPTGECMQDLLEEVRKHRVNIDGDVCTVMITTLVLEGWQRKLDPDLSIMDTLHSLLFKSEWAATLSYTIDGLMAP